MKWIDYGQIFDAKKYGFNYTKSPQAIVFDNYVRIYFSTCKPDNGKLISYVGFADFDKEFKNVLKISDSVISSGNLGCYDEHGIFPFSPVRINGKIYSYNSGWSRRSSVSVDTGIGLAISEDNGETFHRFGNGPVVTSSLHEPFLVIDGFVKHYAGLYYMWYIFGSDWIKFKEGEPAARVYKIPYATSKDGVAWEKSGMRIIPDIIEYESQALPTVIKIDELYHMMFCYRHSYDFRINSERSYQFGYACSIDLKNWERNDSKAFKSNQTWASEMVCYPNLFEIDGRIYLLYNGNQFGKYGFGLAQFVK